MAFRAPVFALLSLSLAACGSGAGEDHQGSATMRPGEDCVSCHHGFTAAGTIYGASDAASGAGVSGASVTIDGQSASVVLTTNSVGSFYTTQAFGFPATVTVSAPGQAARSMGLEGSAYAGCGSCHGTGNRVHSP